MLDESPQSKRLRLKQLADRVDRDVVQHWLRRRRDSLAMASELGLEPATIGVVVGDHMSHDRIDR
jgi:hypothetical protein